MWEVTKDLISRPDQGETSRVGYREGHSQVPVEAIILGFQSEPLPDVDAGTGKILLKIPFRLKDDDGEIYYEGWLHDDEDCFNQIACQKWGEADAGCTTIEVYRDNEWKLEIG